MPQNLEAGGVWSPTEDKTIHTETFWEEAISQYQKSPGTPPWLTIDTCQTGRTVHEDSHSPHNFNNQPPTYQYPPAGPALFLGINTPPVSSTASSRGHHDASSYPVQYITQEPALFASNIDHDDEQLNVGPSIFVFDPQGLNTYGDWSIALPSEPAFFDHQTNSAGGWQHTSLHEIDENASPNQFSRSIEHVGSTQYADLQSDFGTGTIQGYGWSTPHEETTDSITAANTHAYCGTARGGSVISSTQYARSGRAHLLAQDRPSPTKRPRLAAPSPNKPKMLEQTKIVKRGAVSQIIFPTTDHIGRAAYGAKRLEAVNERRRTGACVCCRWMKKTCGMPEGSTETLEVAPCLACTQRMKRMGSHLCFIFNIDNIQMFRPRSPLHTRAATDPIDFIPGTTKWIEIRLTGALQSESISVECLEFKPHSDDVLVKMFGSSQQIPMSPYAIVNLDTYKKALLPRLPALTKIFLEELERSGCSSTVSETFRVAVKYRDEHPTSLVAEALRIWVYSKLCGTEKVLVGAQQLGVAPVQEEGAELEGMVPVPPKVDHQTDTAMIDSMKKDAPILIERLKKMIDDRKRQDWYPIFLTVFIILNNIEFLLRRQGLFLEGMRSYRSMLRSAMQPSEQLNKDLIVVERCISGSEDFISNFTTSADQILQIYQLYASTKRAPFAVKRTARDLEEASLHPHEIAYVESIQKNTDDLINQYRDEHEPKNHRREKRWAAQLFQRLD